MEKRFFVRKDGSTAKFQYVLEGTTYFSPIGQAAKPFHPYWGFSADTGKPIRTNEIDVKVLEREYREATDTERARLLPRSTG